jgi:hypothetical protein
MKKQFRKLMLTKETLKDLGRNDLAQVAGATIGPAGGSCNPSASCPPTQGDTTSNHTIIIIQVPTK